MLEIVSKGFQRAKEALTGQATLTPENIAGALAEVRRSLLEADVELGVARRFVASVEARALGERVQVGRRGAGGREVGPAEHFVAI